MNRSLLLISCFIAGILVGWGIGYLKIPFVGDSFEFWIGILTTIGFFIFLRISSKHSTNFVQKIKLRFVLVSAILLIAAGLSLEYFFNRQSSFLKEQSEIELELLSTKAKMNINEQEIHQFKLVDRMLDKLKGRKFDSLSITEIEDLRILSNTLVPIDYSALEYNDTLPVSPGRGYLLQRLVEMHLQEPTFTSLLSKVNFKQSYLKNVEFKEVDLQGIDLYGSNLSNSRFKNVNFSGANLQMCDFTYSKMNYCILDKADLKEANFKWSELQKFRMAKAIANGSDFSNTDLEDSDLSSTSFKWAKMADAKLKNSNLEKSILWFVDFKNTDLQYANLNGANLVETSFKNAILEEANLSNAQVTKDWFDTLEEQRPAGITRIRKEYSMYQDASMEYPRLKSEKKHTLP